MSLDSPAPAPRCRMRLYLDQAAPLRGTGSGAPRAGLWPWRGPARHAHAVPATVGRCPDVVNRPGAALAWPVPFALDCPAHARLRD